MKNLFKVLSLAALVAVMFASCEKDSTSSYDPIAKNPFVKEVVIEKSYPVKKTPYRRSIRKVFMDDGWGQAQACIAITFTDLSTGKKQEWLYVDVHSQAFNISYLHPNETHTDELSPEYAQSFGGYYQWKVNFSPTTSWDGLVYEDESFTQSINGFKIPTYNDLQKLGSIIGSTSLIPSKLGMKYDGLWANGSNIHFSSDLAGMWMSPTSFDFPNQQPGCGVVVTWEHSSNNRMAVGYTNMPYLGANVRIVRDLN